MRLVLNVDRAGFLLDFFSSSGIRSREQGGEAESGTFRGGLGHALPLPGPVNIEANATAYGRIGEGGGGGLDVKLAGKVSPVGGEAALNIPVAKNGAVANPLAAASRDASQTLTGSRVQPSASGSDSIRGETSTGGTIGEGVVVGAEVASSANLLSNLFSVVGDAIASDLKKMVDTAKQAIDTVRNLGP